MSEPGSDPTEVDPEVDLFLALVRQRYGDRLGPEQLEGVRQAIEAIREQVIALRTVPITNADEPLPRFIPFRADE